MKSKIFIATVILFGTLLSSFKNPANDQFVKFTIKNAGISVEGLFDKFQVKVVFDESNLAQSSFMQSFTLAPWALRGMTKLAVGKTIWNMCTVTFLPVENGCLISSNRDEALVRALAEPPAVYQHNETTLLYPKDPLGGGTWIATGKQATVCLFNGAFEPHVRKPKYRVSRGVIPVQFFDYLDLEDFTSNFDFEGIEPFSLVVYENKKLIELKWDESKLHRFDHSVFQPHIWASATLYSKQVVTERKQWFQDWLDSSPNFDQESITTFHKSKREDHQNGLLIDRANGLKTVSVTSSGYQESEGACMVYEDLIRNVKYNENLAFL